MRRRRGAIHSNDEEEYIKLSILSEKNIGIFYNENIGHSHLTQSTPQHQQLWNKFDYNKQDKMKIQEIQEEQQYSGKILTFNVMVLYSNVEGLGSFVKNCLCKALELPQSPTQNLNNLQLVIKEQSFKGTNLVIKFWLTTLQYHNLLESYYRRAQMFILVGGQQDQGPVKQAIETVKSLKGEKHYDQKFLKAVESNQKQLIQEFQKIRNCLVLWGTQ